MFGINIVRDGFPPTGDAKLDLHNRLVVQMMKNRGVSFGHAHDRVRWLRPDLLSGQAARPDTLETALLMEQELNGRTGVAAWEAVRNTRPELVMGKPGAAIPQVLRNRRGLLANRDFQPTSDWIEIAKEGEYPHEKGLQIIDEEALFRMVQRFAVDAAQPNFPGLLLDFDHQSSDLDKPSIAAGWILELRRSGPSLEGRVDWTKSGEAALTGGTYRLVSPVFTEAEELGKGRLRPSRLHSVALTNAPNIRGLAPLSR